MGRAGRTAVDEHLPRLRRALALDFVVLNVENAAGGFGVTQAVCEHMLEAGADVLTTGNHAFDQRDELDVFEREERLLRPVNFTPGLPGRGAGVFQDKSGRRVLVVNIQGQRGMPQAMNDPFDAIDAELENAPLGKVVDAVVVDMHAETTSEKHAMGHFCDGRASLVVGTHTHIPTADAQILPRGAAYQTDAGMTGDYDSVIGMNKEEPLRRFVTKLPGGRFTPASGEATMCGVFVETDDATGLATRCEMVRVGGRLAEAVPAR